MADTPQQFRWILTIQQNIVWMLNDIQWNSGTVAPNLEAES
jgi:hypothetical protein